MNIFTIKVNIHSSCEIEYLVETHLCKLCVILRLCVLLAVSPHEEYSSTTLPLGLRCSLHDG